MEFDESRPYAPGDDVRSLDWRVTARTAKPHTKLYREERERPVYICVDFRSSMFFASRGVYKSVMAAKMAALLAWRAKDQGDRIGGSLFSEAGIREIAPKSGQRAVLQWLNGLVTFAKSPETRHEVNAREQSIQNALRHLGNHVKPGSQVYLLSDFRHLTPSGAESISRIAKQSSVTLIFIYDPLEEKLPEASLSFSYQGNMVTLPDDQKMRAIHAAGFISRQQYVQSLAAKHRILFRSISTTDPLSRCV